MGLLLSVPGASAEEISRGVGAAHQALERAGFTVEQAAHAAFAVEGWDWMVPRKVDWTIGIAAP